MEAARTSVLSLHDLKNSMLSPASFAPKQTNAVKKVDSWLDGETLEQQDEDAQSAARPVAEANPPAVAFASNAAAPSAPAAAVSVRSPLSLDVSAPTAAAATAGDNNQGDHERERWRAGLGPGGSEDGSSCDGSRARDASRQQQGGPRSVQPGSEFGDADSQLGELGGFHQRNQLGRVAVRHNVERKNSDEHSRHSDDAADAEVAATDAAAQAAAARAQASQAAAEAPAPQQPVYNHKLANVGRYNVGRHTHKHFAKNRKHKLMMDMQVDRAMTETPRAVRLQILEQAYPTVLKTVQLYQQHLGDKEPITIQAIEHLRTLSQILDRKCEY